MEPPCTALPLAADVPSAILALSKPLLPLGWMDIGRAGEGHKKRKVPDLKAKGHVFPQDDLPVSASPLPDALPPLRRQPFQLHSTDQVHPPPLISPRLTLRAAKSLLHKTCL